MPKHKRVTCALSASEEESQQHSTDKASAVKKRRRDMHKQLSPDKREAFLLQRRTRYQESCNQNLLNFSPALTNNEESPPSCPQHRLTGQRGVTIAEIPPVLPPHSETGNTSAFNTSGVVLGKGKNIIGCPCIFEIGSTSATVADQHNPEATTIDAKGSTSVPHQWTDPKEMRNKNKGIAAEEKDVSFERNIIVTEEDLLLHTKLNTEQKIAYDIILQRVFTNKSGAFFIDGPGGSGKIFLYRALLATVRSKGFIALATATSGVAASILPGGRTAHSRFKSPINIDEQFTCNISKQSSLASLIRDAKLIVWDEVSMSKKNMIEAFDLLLKDLTDTNVLFGGKVIVFGGDFRQMLPVVRSGKKEDFICQSILNSKIWNQLKKLRLLENMRARTDPSFCEYLMRIGNGKENTNLNNKIEIPKQFIIPFTTEKESLNLLFKIIYPNLHLSFNNSSFMTSRVILTTKNDFVDEINDRLIAEFPTDANIFIATDETIEPNDQTQFEDFLHTVNPLGLPPYKLILKQNCPVILLRNLNPSEGLCNADRMQHFSTHRNVVDALHGFHQILQLCFLSSPLLLYCQHLCSLYTRLTSSSNEVISQLSYHARTSSAS